MSTLMRSVAGGLLAALALAISGCSTALSGLTPDQDLYKFLVKVDDVEFGMNKARVQFIMGPPRNRLYEGNQEAWLWCQTSISQDRADAYLTVYFHGTRVAGIHTYGNRAEGSCENFFRRVEWLADPEKSLAAKVRRRD
jgi:hypothetical protein